MFAIVSPPVGLSAWFALIIDGLCGAVGARAPRDPAAPLLMLVYRRLRRLVARFTRLVEQVAAGTLPVPRVRGVRARRAGRPGLCWPGGFAWLVRLVPEAAAFGSQLQHLLRQPEMAALMAAAPQMGRMFGPLGRMLAVEMGPGLRRPAKIRTPIPQAEPPATASADAEIVVPEWARQHWPGHDYAGREPPERTPAPALDRSD